MAIFVAQPVDDIKFALGFRRRRLVRAFTGQGDMGVFIRNQAGHAKAGSRPQYRDGAIGHRWNIRPDPLDVPCPQRRHPVRHRTEIV